MRYALMIEPQQGMRYADLLAVAQLAEKAGFEALFRSDHYTSFPGDVGLPTTDAWATLAGLARETSRIRIGSLVSPMTFRLLRNDYTFSPRGPVEIKGKGMMETYFLRGAKAPRPAT